MNLGRTPSAILPAPIVLLTVVSLVAVALGACQRGAASARHDARTWVRSGSPQLWTAGRDEGGPGTHGVDPSGVVR